MCFFANHNDSNQHRIQITARDAFRNLTIAGYIAYISDSTGHGGTTAPTQFAAAAQLTWKSTFTLRNSHYHSLAAHHPTHPHRPNVMIHPRKSFLPPKKYLGAAGISYAGGRSELELAMGEGLRVFFELRP